MPYFYNHEEKYVLITNYKVMYKTLCHQPSLRLLEPRWRMGVYIWLKPRLKYYLLVRNPYDRLVSFYSNKFLAVSAPRPGKGWGPALRLFFPAMGLTGREETPTVAARIQTFRFSDFMENLPSRYRRDVHLLPQCRLIRPPVAGIPIPVRKHKMFRMEEDLAALGRELRLDVSIRLHSSEHGPHAQYFTPATYALANAVYRRDFELFGYPIRT